MSTSVDQRVVEMRFDNQHFERNVATSMSTLDKLKQKLHFSGATKGLEDINTATKKVDMGGLGNMVDSVSAKFSALQVMGVTALANITNSAVNAGKNIIKSLTIDPIMSGFSEYETKMGSIQTILANTEHQGATLDDVVAVLDELNLYADKTIYNFQEMTRNIGTFTAAGVDLETSARSIQGIANLAAVSGSTSQQASTAMYQLSQALASGTVKLMDWNSVVNAGMGGKVFQNALIRTAAVMAGSAEDVEAWQQKNIDAYGSFRDSLTQSGWLTTEVLTATLEQFTMAAEEGSEEWEAFKKSLMDSGYTEKQAEEILKMANTASDAATKVKTFTQLMDTLKESAQSGWAQTWELLIGDFEEAKAFFTQLSDIFGGIIGESADRRNNLFGGALNSNWDKLVNVINEAGHEMSEFEESIRNVVGDDVLDPLIEKYGSLEKAIKGGAIASDVLKQALDFLGGSSHGELDGLIESLRAITGYFSWGSVGDDVKHIQTALDTLGYDLGSYGVDGIIGQYTTAAIKAFQEANGLMADGIVGPNTLAALDTAISGMNTLNSETGDLRENCEALIDDITKKGGRELLLESLLNIVKAIHRPLQAVGEAFRETFAISSDQVYNVLEGFNKLTDSLVMKGPLDAKNWAELSDSLKKLGIDTWAFKDKLKVALQESGVDVDALIKKYGTLEKAFDDGAISMGTVADVLLSFDGMSKALLEGGENADKLKRTFEGLFAVFEIIGAFASGGLSVAFRVLKNILSKFDMDILGFTASLGDAIVAFRDWLFETNSIAKFFDWALSKLPVVVDRFKAWFNIFKQTPAVQKLVTALQEMGEAFTKFFSGEIDSSELARNLGTNLANALKALPEIAVQFGKDFIAGFTGGISGGITDAISAAIDFCKEFIAAFAAALGIHSPSVIAEEQGSNWVEGLINGLQGMVSALWNTIKSIGEYIVGGFEKIGEWLGKIDWGKILSGGLLAALSWVAVQFGKGINSFNGFVDEIGGILDSVRKVLNSFKKVLNMYAFDLFTHGLLNIALAVVAIAGALWLMSTADPAKLWNAVGVLEVVAWTITVMALLMTKISDTTMSIDWKKGIDLKGMNSMILQIGITILLIGIVAKILGSMKTEELEQGLNTLAAIAIGLVVFVAAMGGISAYSKDTDKIGKMLTKIAVAMLLMIVVCKLASRLSEDEISRGVGFAIAFTLFVAALVQATKSAGRHASRMGTLILQLVVALGMMALVTKLVGTLSYGEMFKGVLFAAAFALFVRHLTNTAAKHNGEELAKVGGLVLSVGGAMMMMAAVVKIIAGVSVGGLLKGLICVGAFALIIAGMVKLVKGSSANDLNNVAKTIMSVAGAIALLALVAVALSYVPLGGLIKGTLFVAALGLIVSGLIKSLKGAQNVKGSLIAITVALGILAGALIWLSYLDPANVAVAAAAMAMIMGMFALIVKSSNNVQASIKTVVTMTVAVAALAGILAYLTNQIDNPAGAIQVAIALGVLMLALATSMQSVSKVEKFSWGAIGTLAAMVGVMALVAVVLGILAAMHIEPSINTAIALGVLMIALAASMRILSSAGLNGLIVSDMIGPMYAMVGVLALVAIVVGVLEHLDCAPSIETAVSLSILLLALAGVTAILAIAAPAAAGAFVGALALAGVVIVLGALLVGLGALCDKFPEVERFLDEGIPILEKIGVGIGKFVGGLIGGIGEGMMDSFVVMVDSFGLAVDRISEISGVAEGIDAGSFDGVSAFIGVLGEIGSASISSFWTELFNGWGSTTWDQFKADALGFVGAMKEIAAEATGITIDEDSFDAIVKGATAFAGLNESISPIATISSDLVKFDTSLSGFGADAASFLSEIKTAFDSIPADYSYNETGLASIIAGATELAKLQNTIEPIATINSGLTTYANDLASFGLNVSSFIDQIKIAFDKVDGYTFDVGALMRIILATQALSNLQHTIEPGWGIFDLFTGSDGLAGFANNAILFVDAMKTALSAVKDFEYDTDAFNSIISAAEDLQELQAGLPNVGGIVSWFKGNNGLSTFGNQVEKFMESMADAFDALGDTTIDDADITNVENVIKAADKFKEFITTFEDFTVDKKAIRQFTGVGNGGFGADGPMYRIAAAMKKMSDELAGVNLTAIDSAASSAGKIRDLMATLNGIRLGGIQEFTGWKTGDPGYDGVLHHVAGAIKDFSDQLSDTNFNGITIAAQVASSIAFTMEKLSTINIAGVEAFIGTGDDQSMIERIGLALAGYGTSVAGINFGAIVLSVAAARLLASFIGGLDIFANAKANDFANAINTLADANVDGFVTAFSGSYDELSSIGTDIVNAIAEGITTGMSSLQGLVTGMSNLMIFALRVTSVLYKFIGAEIIGEFVAGLNEKASDPAAAMSRIATSTASAASDSYISFYTAGMNMVLGFANGISSTAFAAEIAARAMALAAAEAAKDALDINSPSRVAYGIGDFFGMGFINAVGDYVKTAYDTSAEMAGSAKKGLQDSIGKISDLISSDMDAQPTIRPVLDLSDVRAGAGAIGSLLNTDASVGVMSNINSISTMMNRRNQNGGNGEVVSAIDRLGKNLANVGGTSYNINGITYDRGSELDDAIRTIVRYARIEGRV